MKKGKFENCALTCLKENKHPHCEVTVVAMRKGQQLDADNQNVNVTQSFSCKGLIGQLHM